MAPPAQPSGTLNVAGPSERSAPHLLSSVVLASDVASGPHISVAPRLSPCSPPRGVVAALGDRVAVSGPNSLQIVTVAVLRFRGEALKRNRVRSRLRCAADELEALAESERAEPHRDHRRELTVLGWLYRSRTPRPSRAMMMRSIVAISLSVTDSVTTPCRANGPICDGGQRGPPRQVTFCRDGERDARVSY
jgi:hypothetical protein